ncbi:MAG: hypothetical protein JJV98_14190 [Desulfosarcina sp.]|nr:hypothetical protein [Desulfobacterales bacterium]
MRALMIVGLLIVLLIVGLLTMQNMGVRSNDGQTETQAKDYIERAEDATKVVEEKVRGLQEQLNQSD